MILIHTALLCEAQSFIEYYKLQKIHTNPKIYANDILIICISGIGVLNTTKALDYIYKNYSISKAFNIGIAGCNDTNIMIGSIYCTNHIVKSVPHLPLITKDNVVVNSDIKQTTLYDMEAKYFHEISTQYLEKKYIYIFKVVSDYLNSDILQKDYIKSLISKQKIIHQFIKVI